MGSVTIKPWTIKANQSIFDIALQLYGTPAQAVKLILDNGISDMDQEMNPGDVLNYDVVTTSFPLYFSTNKIVVSNWEGVGSTTPPNIELLDDSGGYELRDDSGLELRDAG